MRPHVPVGVLLAAAALPVSRSAAQQFGQGGSPLVGTWNAQNAQGTVQGTVMYGPDGASEAVFRMPMPGYDGMMLVRMTGRYQAEPVGAGRYRVRISLTRTVPSQVCQTVDGRPAGCRAIRIPDASEGGVAFVSRDAFRDETGLFFVRANGPGLLTMRVPPQLVVNAKSPPPSGAPGSVVAGGYTTPGGSRYISPRRPSSPTDGNLQQQRICTINDGHIVTHPDGRQECKAPY